MSMRVWRGQPYPLGATWDGEGVNFALFSENATSVELCLYDERDPAGETHRIPIEERTDLVWHAYLPEVRPGLHVLEGGARLGEGEDLVDDRS